MNQPCDAVLFDCDGVLVDSDTSVIEAWTRWASDYGLDADDVLAIVHGRRAADTVELLIEPKRREAALTLINRYEIEDAQGATAIPGALELTRVMPQDRWAVVTSGTTALARVRLKAAGFERPRVLISADDVERGKPDPAGYSAAAARLGVLPERSVVLEDAVAGIAAARAAGVGFVVGVGGRGLAEVADVLVSDLRQVSWVDSGLQIAPG